MLIDINGDGLDDWLYSDGTKPTSYSTPAPAGKQRPQRSGRSQPRRSTSRPSRNNVYYDRGIRFFDINGDGLPDFVHSYQMSYTTKNGGVATARTAPTTGSLLNTGNGWATSTAYTLPSTIVTGHVTSGNWDGTFTYNEYANWIGNGQFAQDVMTTVTNSKGGNTSVTYTPTTNARQAIPNCPTPARRHRDRPLRRPRQCRDHDVLVFRRQEYISLRRARPEIRWLCDHHHDRSRLAHEHLLSAKASAPTTSLGEQSDGYAPDQSAVPQRHLRSLRQSHPTNFYRWDSSSRGNNATSSISAGKSSKTTPPTAPIATKRPIILYSTTTGDLLTQIDYGEVTGNSDGTFTDTGTDKRTTSTTYAASSSVNLSVPDREESSRIPPAQRVSDQKLYYDNLPFGQVSLGNNTRQEDWISGTTYASSTKTYNAYGLVATSTDRRGYATGYKYDAFNLYVATATNPLNQKTQYLYNYANGKAEADDRSQQSSHQESLRRRRPSRRSRSIRRLHTIAPRHVDHLPIHRQHHHALDHPSHRLPHGHEHRRHLRLLRRPQSSRAGAQSLANRRHLRRERSALQSCRSARLDKLPYFSSGSGFTISDRQSARSTPPTPTTRSSASSPRATSSARPRMSTPSGRPPRPTRTATSKTTCSTPSAISPTSSSTSDQLATTTYTYDAANNLATTTDSQGNVRGFTYDGLGRRLTAQDLHAPGHTPFGIWSYGYDDAGNMISQIDPKGSTTTRTYDALGRLLTETNAGTTQVTNTYDSCTNGIGYLCVASSTSAKTQNATTSSAASALRRPRSRAPASR